MNTTACNPEYRVLVVDDESSIRLLISRALTQVGFRCQTAADGIEALQILQTGEFDAVVTDVRMPNRNGHSLAIELLARGDRPVVVVLTGVLEPKIAHDLILRGVDEVCFKPVNSLVFATKIKALVQRRRSVRAPLTSPRPQHTSPAPPTGPILRTEAPNGAAKALKDASVNRETASLAPNGSDPAAKHVVVILRSDRDASQRFAAAVAAPTIEAIVADGSESFRELLNTQRVDLVVLEQQLGGFLTGTEILERLHRDLLRPDVILLAESRPGIQDLADRLDVKRLLSPSSDQEEIAEAVRAVLASASSSKIFIPQKARRLVEECGEIRPLPQILVKILGYLDLEMDQIPLKELADTIALDSQATASLLAMTNSASSGLRQHVTRVADAVALLGPRRTITLVVSSATLATQTDLLQEWSEPLRNWYGQRSVLIASAASTFARRLDEVSPDTAFVLGLLQDIGILVLGNCFPGRYAETTIRRTREIPQVQLATIESEDYGVTHAEVSAAMLHKWNLPASLVGLVLGHHAKGGSGRSRLDRGFLRAMRIGEALAELSDLPHPVRRQTLNRLMNEYGPKTSRECSQAVEEAVTLTAQSCKLFAVPVPDNLAFDHLTAKLTTCREELLTAP